MHSRYIRSHEFLRIREAAELEAEQKRRAKERWLREKTRRQDEAAQPSPATHAILTVLKAGETVYEADKLPKTLFTQ